MNLLIKATTELLCNELEIKLDCFFHETKDPKIKIALIGDYSEAELNKIYSLIAGKKSINCFEMFVFSDNAVFTYNYLNFYKNNTHELSNFKVALGLREISQKYFHNFDNYSNTIPTLFEKNNKNFFDILLCQIPKNSLAWEELLQLWHKQHLSLRRTGILLAAGSIKHMHKNLNKIALKYFDTVSASKGYKKARILRVGGYAKNQSNEVEIPKKIYNSDFSFDLFPYGSTFGGGKTDMGSLLLLETFFNKKTISLKNSDNFLDLGCGSGIVALNIYKKFPNMNIYACDISWSAVASTLLAFEKNFSNKSLRVTHDYSGNTLPINYFDYVLLNPPFHNGTNVDYTLAHDLISSAHSRLKKGGELWLVCNRHINYSSYIKKYFTKSSIISHNNKFIVLKADK